MAPADEIMPVFPGEVRPGARRGKNGFHRLAQEGAGRWWWVDPEGGQSWCRAVHGLDRVDSGDGAPGLDPAARLRRWDFNAIGVGRSTAGREDGLPFMATVDFCVGAPLMVAPGVRLPDVFDPEWARLAAFRARAVCPFLAEERALLGWVTDDSLAWGQPVAGTPGRPTLLQLCLSLEPGFAAYHAAWEFVLASHAGRMDVLSRAWGVAIANKEVVREMTRAEQGLATRGYRHDEAAWTREFARRYFSATSVAIRRADPNHLVLGCRFRGPAGPAVLGECVYPAIDVAMPDWHELPAPALPAANPVLAGDVRWGGPASVPARRRGRLTTLERMLRGARTALERLAVHPAVVGYAWAQWRDEPGEQPPFARGLVHVNDAEAREHTELLADFNQRCETLRRTVPPAASV